MHRCKNINVTLFDTSLCLDLSETRQYLPHPEVAACSENRSQKHRFGRSCGEPRRPALSSPCCLLLLSTISSTQARLWRFPRRKSRLAYRTICPTRKRGTPALSSIATAVRWWALRLPWPPSSRRSLRPCLPQRGSTTSSHRRNRQKRPLPY